MLCKWLVYTFPWDFSKPQFTECCHYEHFSNSNIQDLYSCLSGRITLLLKENSKQSFSSQLNNLLTYFSNLFDIFNILARVSLLELRHLEWKLLMSTLNKWFYLLITINFFTGVSSQTKVKEYGILHWRKKCHDKCTQLRNDVNVKESDRLLSLTISSFNSSDNFCRWKVDILTINPFFNFVKRLSTNERRCLLRSSKFYVVTQIAR